MKGRDIGFVVGIIVVIAAAYVGYTSITGAQVTGQVTGGEDLTLGQCLTEKGVTMYGAYWCGHCNNQKAAFGSDFENVNYVECDPNGPEANPALCQAKGIEGYPTWEINGQLYPGEKPLETLASLAGCEL